MSNIITRLNLSHADTGMSFNIALSRDADTEGFDLAQVAVTTTESSVASAYSSARNVILRLLSGDDVKVGLATTVYPLRLSGANDSMLPRLDVEGLREITTVTCAADVAGSLDGDYVELRELADAKVWAWFNMARKASQTLTLTANAANNETVVIGAKTYTFKTALTPAANEVLIGAAATDSIDNLIAAVNLAAGIGTTYGTGTTVNASCTAEAGAGDTMIARAITAGTAGNSVATTETLANGSWGAATLAGGTASSTAPTPTTERLVQVDITEGATAAAIATALAAALTADAGYTSAIAATADVTITDRHTGTRTAATAGTTGWSTPSETQAGAASPSVFLKSAGTSQVMVAVAPN